ncbi:glycosyltransferase family 2 protein [uncultured Chryseobacterium sp.]|uniref:glycosyltransferase family A protein n=1 Tax=uncultured Chryseobacterium sp. TaxID=259322 RepID=UPI0025CEFAED|nr:glycosyltransferase family 2 protein [uncultured Chryseobacterium sp.]
MNPLVSVIIPNYNHEKFLPQRLQSVFEQTYDHFEVILLDDCSTDNSSRILQEYASHPKTSHIVINKENSGSPFAQWEKGIRLAKGDYIWIAESDDFAETSFLERLMPLFFKKENVGLVYSRSNNVDENGRFYDIFWPDSLDEKRWQSSHYNEGKDEIRNFLKFRNTIPNASACIFRKQDFDFSKMKTMFYSGDWLFWTMILLTGNICFCSDVLNHFRFHDKTTRSLKSATNAKYQEYLYVLSFIYKNINEKLGYERNHFWIYYELRKQSVSPVFLFRKARPFFYAYAYFRYKLLKYRIRTKILHR